MLRYVLTAALLASPLMLSGCSEAVAALTSAAANSAASKVKVSGTIYAPAAQVAVVSAGALNYVVQARSDEKGVPQAKVSFIPLGGFLPAGSGQTDSTGKYGIEVPANGQYQVEATFETKDGQEVTLTGLAVVSGSGASFHLDAAHHLVAAKLLSQGVRKVDASQLESAYSQMNTDLSKVSQVPTPTNRTSAALTFDEVASDSLKKLVQELSK